MGVPRADLDGFEALEAGLEEAVADLAPGLVAEGLAQGQPDAVGDPLLGAVPELLGPVLGVQLLDQEHPARR